MMRNLLALIGAGTLAFVGLGWNLGWYKITRQPAAPGTQRFNLDVNPVKIAADGKMIIERGSEFFNQLSDGSQSAPGQPFAATPGDSSAGAPLTGQKLKPKSPNDSENGVGMGQAAGEARP